MTPQKRCKKWLDRNGAFIYNYAENAPLIILRALLNEPFCVMGR